MHYEHLSVITGIIGYRGIESKGDLHPNVNLVIDLTYKTGDIAELTRMAGQAFQIHIDVKEYSSFTTLRSVVYLLNNRQIKRNLTEPFFGYPLKGQQAVC